MAKIQLYIAQSLNGKIARKNGSVDWLEAIPNPEGLDYGYAGFYKSIGITIQGYSTYKQVLDWGIDFPYKGKKNYVLTRKTEPHDNEDVSFVKSDPSGFIKALKNTETDNIWVIGGGQINTLLFNAGLIDEIILFVMPIVIPEGISLFEGLPIEKQLTLIDQKSYSTGVMSLHYQVKNENTAK